MSVRKIEYIVTAEGISPAVKQFGGVQGDHRATEIVFKIDKGLDENLKTQVKNDGGKLIYRVDGYNAEGGVVRSEPVPLDSSKVQYMLEESITRYGGLVRAVLVISMKVNNTTEMELFNFPAMLQLKNLPEGAETDENSRESMSVLAQVAKEASAVASTAAKEATEAKDKTELAKAALEGGAEWVFDGGSPAEELDIEFVIDSQMSDSSENAVMNKVAKAYVDGEFEKFRELLEEKINEVKLDAHPVGSYYWSSEATNPDILFGGTWEQVEGRFILAAGRYIDKNGTDRTYSVGEADEGEYVHKLDIGEMPKHAHAIQKQVSNDAGNEIYVGSGDAKLYYSNTNDDITLYTGEDRPHNNMPPYEVAYCWKRTK